MTRSSAKPHETTRGDYYQRLYGCLILFSPFAGGQPSPGGITQGKSILLTAIIRQKSRELQPREKNNPRRFRKGALKA
jgi:hypothetical protein